MYFLCAIFHYIASHVYIAWCVPYGFRGFIMSTFLTLSPHCQALRWAIYNGGICINTMWFLLGGWFLNKFQQMMQYLLHNDNDLNENDLNENDLNENDLNEIDTNNQGTKDLKEENEINKKYRTQIRNSRNSRNKIS